MADLFWKTLIREYLLQLQERQKWLVKKCNFQVGDIVLVVDDTAPRSSWIMGKIQIIKDKRGLTHQVRIKTKTHLLDQTHY